MQITIETSSRTFRHTFTLSLAALSLVFFTAAAYSWDGPISSPPNSNTAAPVNVGTDSQVKSGPLSVDGLSVYGSHYIQNNLGIGTTPSSAWGMYAIGSQGGVYGHATDGQAIRGLSDSGYGGYFIGQGGVYAQNHAGYYSFLAYPGSSWSVYSNGPTYTSNYSRADGGFCIGGSCTTSWPACSWNGTRVAHGNGGGCFDDMYMTCSGGRIIQVYMGCNN